MELYHQNMNRIVLSLVYEGKLGSSRADSTYVLENAECFSEICQVRIIVSRRDNWEIPPSIREKFEVIEVGTSFNPKNIFQSIFGQLRFSWNVRKLTISGGRHSEVFLFHDWWPTQFMRFFTKFDRNKLIFLEVHNQIPLNIIGCLLFRHIDLFIATNELKSKELQAFFSNKVIVEKNCVRLSRYINLNKNVNSINKPNPYTHSTRRVVGYTGSLGSEKNPRLFFETIKLLPQYDFLFVGKVPSSFKRTADALPNLYQLGTFDRNDVPRFQISCDLLLVTLDPSNEVSSKYTSTMKLLEYIAACRPIVAPKLPSIIELLDITEFYSYSADDPYDCANAIERAFMDLRKNPRLPDPSRLSQYSWGSRNKRILLQASQQLISIGQF
jgi:glycosyltransferase involved in cell wall biosynthesis